MGEYADEHRAQEQQCIKDAYTEPDDGKTELDEDEIENQRKIDVFLEFLNHIVYAGRQNLPMYKTPEMMAKTNMTETIRNEFMRIFEISKEKIENYQPPEDFEVDGEDDEQ